MKGFNLLLLLVFSSTTIFTSTSVGQQNTSVPLSSVPVNIKEIVSSISPVIEDEYLNESILVLKADEDALLVANGTITPFWLAIDAVKHFGYSVSEITKP